METTIDAKFKEVDGRLERNGISYKILDVWQPTQGGTAYTVQRRGQKSRTLWHTEVDHWIFLN